MRLDGIPVFAALKDAMSFNAARSKVLAVNVANTDTHGFMPQDISEGDLARALRANQRTAATTTTVKRTNPGHIEPPSARARAWRAEASPDSETTLDGNAVVLEEQMAKVAETRLQYETAVGLYEKTLSLVRIAVKSPGR